MVTPTNRVRNEHGTHDKCHQYRQGEAKRERSPVAVLLSSVENEAIGRVGHHRSTYGRSDSRPRTNNVQLPPSFFAGWGALVIDRKSSTAHLARLTLVALVVCQVTLAPAGPAAAKALLLSPGDVAMQLTPEADISLAQSASPDPVAPDSDLTYSIELVNPGPDSATSVLLSETIPSGTTIVSWVAKNFGTFFSCSVPGQPLQ